MQVTLRNNLNLFENKQTYKTQNVVQNHRAELQESYRLPAYNQVYKSNINFRGLSGTSVIGYDEEMSRIKQILIDPLNSRDKENIPSAILLVFSDPLMAPKIVEDIAKASNANAKTINIMNNDAISVIDSSLNEARNNYLSTGKRSLFILPTPERIIGMSPAYAKDICDFELDHNDIKELGKLNNNSKNITYFKAILDHIQETPRNKNDFGKSAATIIMVTQKPQLIHPDLLSREGKIKTVFFPPLGSNIKDVIKNEHKKLSESLASLKTRKKIEFEPTKENYLLTLRDETYTISEKAKTNIERMKANDEIDNLNFDFKNIPYEKLSLFAKDESKGAYTIRDLKKVVQKTFTDYLEDPSIPYSVHFTFNFATSNREISQSRLQKLFTLENIFSKNFTKEGPFFDETKIDLLRQIFKST